MAGKKIYKRSLGVFELVSLGVGGTVGSGIFVVPGIAAGLSGSWSLLAWIIVALSASCVLLSLASVTHRFTRFDNFFSMFRTVFGSWLATSLIVLYLISSVFGVSTIAAGIGQYVSFFGFSDLLVIELAVIGIFCCLNMVGISLSGITENILTTLKIIPLLVISILLMPFIKVQNFTPHIPLTTSGLLATIIIVYWPFTGFEISAIPVEETRDPKIIRRSLFLVMGVVVVVYFLLNISLIGSVGADTLAGSPAPIAAATGLVFQQSGPLVAYIGIVAMLSAINAYIIGTSRVLHSVSVGLSIPIIRDLNTRGIPANALIAGSIISAFLLFLSNHFDRLATVSVITTLIPYIFFCLASWVLVTDVKSRVVAAAGAISTASILVLYCIT